VCPVLPLVQVDVKFDPGMGKIIVNSFVKILGELVLEFISGFTEMWKAEIKTSIGFHNAVIVMKFLLFHVSTLQYAVR